MGRADPQLISLSTVCSSAARPMSGVYTHTSPPSDNIYVAYPSGTLASSSLCMLRTNGEEIL